MQVSVSHGEASRGEALWWKWLKALPASAAWSQGQNSLKKIYLETPMPKKGPEWGRATSAGKGEKGQDVNVPWTPPTWASGPRCPQKVGRKGSVPEPFSLPRFRPQAIPHVLRK